MRQVSDRKIAYDCRYFLGDKPCVWHKQKGVVCECEHYDPLKKNLLIIKLDAMGDVLRTTSLLPVINKAWPGMRITWITRLESIPLLDHNPFITEIIPYGPEALVHLSSRIFDRVINLDAGKISSGMASMAKATEKMGYVLHEQGYVHGTNRAAEEWLQMGISDDLKKENKRSYQEIMCSIIGLPTEGLKYVMQLTETEMAEGLNHFRRIGIDPKRPVIGIHTGGGGRWSLKQWNEHQFLALIPELVKEHGKGIQIVLFGGPLECELNASIMGSMKGLVYDAGCDNGVRHFAALIHRCSVVLAGDTLAMHIALAMGRRTVVLFGPTSNTEIDLFGMGDKVIPDLSCLSCYRPTCDKTPNCMDMISVESVKQAISRQLKISRT